MGAVVYAKHEPYWETNQPFEVKDLMFWAGPPTIRCVDVNEMFSGASPLPNPHSPMYVALEGSHRLAACDFLGLSPKLVLEKLDLHYDDIRESVMRLCYGGKLPRYEFPVAWVLDLRGEKDESRES